MIYLVSVKMCDKRKVFEFKTAAGRDTFLNDLRKMNVDYIVTEQII